MLTTQAVSGCSSVRMTQENEQNKESFSNLQSLSDSIPRCDIAILRKTEEHINQLNYVELYDFLYTFSKDCSTNIEYSEYSNELLFKVLEKHTKEFIRCISQEEDISQDYIYAELSTPILDINVEVIYGKVKDASGDHLVKEKVLKALEKAKEY